MYQKFDEKSKMYYNSNIPLFYRPMNSPRETSEHLPRRPEEIEVLKNNFFKALDVFIKNIDQKQIDWITDLIDVMNIVSFEGLFLNTEVILDLETLENWELLKTEYDPLLDREIQIEFTILIQKLTLRKSETAF